MKAVPMVSSPKSTKTVHIAIGFFFFVNYIVGVGFLGIPKTFNTAGFFPSFITLVAISFFAWTTATWVIEVVSRAQALEDANASRRNTYSTAPPTHPDFRLDADRKFEQTELCEMFVGKWLKYVYTVILSIALFSTLWAYGTVAGSAWSSNLPLKSGPFNMCIIGNDSDFNDLPVPNNAGCLASYRFCVFLFAVIVIPMSLLDLKEQSIVQTALGLARFTLIGSIVLYCIVKMIQGAAEENPLAPQNSTSNYTNEAEPRHYAQDVESISFTGWMGSIPVFLLAQTLHPGIIALAHPIRQKQHMHWLLLAVFIVSSTFYIAMGTATSLWFGDKIESTATLNWVPFTMPGNSIQLRMLSYLIVIFPSLDVCTTYPLLVCTLVNNLFLVFVGKDTSQIKTTKHRWICLGLRAAIAILPIMCAILLSNLLYVLTYSGLATFFNFFFFPAILQLFSQRQCVKVFGCNQKTGFIDSHAAQGDSESLPLVQKSPLPSQCTTIATMLGNKVLYWTPYSFPVISHPLFVVFIAGMGAVLFIFGLTGTVINTVRGELT